MKTTIGLLLSAAFVLFATGVSMTTLASTNENIAVVHEQFPRREVFTRDGVTNLVRTIFVDSIGKTNIREHAIYYDGKLALTMSENPDYHWITLTYFTGLSFKVQTVLTEEGKLHEIQLIRGNLILDRFIYTNGIIAPVSDGELIRENESLKRSLEFWNRRNYGNAEPTAGRYATNAASLQH